MANNSPGKPLISVVVPAYNVATVIEECIHSILDQTHQNLEVIVVDDGSVDATAEQVRRCADPRITLVTKDNGGAGSARNAGLRQVRGTFVAFLDADDLWMPTKLEESLAAIGCHVAVGNLMQYVNEDGRRLPSAAGERPGEMSRIAAAEFLPFPLSSILFRRNVIDQVGFFDEDLPRSQDLDFISRVASIGSFGFIDRVLGFYRLRADSLSASGHANQRMYWRFVMARRAGDKQSVEQFVRDYSLSKKERRSDMAAVSYRRGGLRLSAGDKLGVFDILRSISISPRYALPRLLRHSRSAGGVSRPASSRRGRS